MYILFIMSYCHVRANHFCKKFVGYRMRTFRDTITMATFNILYAQYSYFNLYNL